MTLFLSIYIIFALLGAITACSSKQILVKQNFFKTKYTDLTIIYLFTCFLTLTLLCGLRDKTIGTDTIAYVDTFLNRNILLRTIDGQSKFEIGYTTLVKFISSFTSNENVFIFILALLTYYFTYYYIKNNCNGAYELAVLAYMPFLNYINFSALRQGLALAIGINSLRYIKDRKWLQASVIIVIASLFHSTALILFAFIPLSLTSWTRRKVGIGAICSALVVVFFDPIVNIVLRFFPIYRRYWQSSWMTSDKSNIGIFAIMVMAFCVFTIINLFRRKDLQEDEVKELTVYLVGSIFCLVLNLLGRQYGLFSRVARYYIPCVIVLIVDIYKYLLININLKKIYFLIIACFMGVYFYVIMSNDVYGIFPYKFFWS